MSALGDEAMKSVPVVEQVFVTAPADTHKFAFELKLFKARRRAEKLLAAEGDDEFYVTHLSCRVLVYKGLVMPEYLASRSEEHTSELQSLMRISYAVFCLKKKHTSINHNIL